MGKSGEDNRIDEKAGDIYLESPLNEEMTVLTEDGGSLLLSEWGYERENMEFSLSGEVYKLELVKAFRDQWKETSGEYTPEGDMPPLYQANKKNPKSINDINFKNWLWREYHIKLEDIILLESQLNENLALALRHQNKIGITHTSDGIRITEENKYDPVIQKEIYEDWKKNSGQYDPIYLNYGYTESGPMPAKSEKVNLWAGKKIEITCGSSSIIIDGEGERQDWKALDIYLRSPLNKPVAMLTNNACTMLLSALEESRQAEIPRFTPDGIKITNDNKYQTAILEYLESWYDENWRPMQQLLKNKENFINVLKINHPELYEKLLNENPDFYEELCDIYSVERRLQGPGKLYSEALGYEKPQKLKDLEALAEVYKWTRTYYGLSEMEWRTGTLDGATATLGQLASLGMLAYAAYSIATSTASSVNTYSSVNQMQKTVATGRMAVSKSGDIGYIMRRPKTWLSPARNNMVVYTSTNEIVAYIEKRNGQAQLLLFTDREVFTRTIDKLVMTSGANAANQSVWNQQGLLMGAAGRNLLTNTNSPTLPPTNPSRLQMQSVMVRQSIESIFRSTALPVVQEQFVKAVMGEEFPYFISVPSAQQTSVSNSFKEYNKELERRPYIPYTDERRKYIIQPDNGHQAYLERQYIEIREKGLEDVPTVAKNTGLTEKDILEMKKHLFLKTHNLSIKGRPYEELYFQADPEVAYIWKEAQQRELTKAEKDWFEALAKHELAESQYMTQEGLPLKDVSTYNEKTKTYAIDPEKNAHDKANAAAPQPNDLEGCPAFSDFLKYYDKDPNNY